MPVPTDDPPPPVAGARLGVASSLRRASAVVAVASMAANILGYALVLVLTRSLAPAELGAVGALLNLTVIGAVPALSIQLVTASRTARLVHHPSSDVLVLRLRRRVLRIAVGVGTGLAVLLAVAAQPLSTVLHLDGTTALLLVAGGLFPTTIGYALQGLLQGLERFWALSVVFVLTAGFRFTGGAIAGLLGWGVDGVMAGTAAGAVAAGVAALIVVRVDQSPGPTSGAQPAGAQPAGTQPAGTQPAGQAGQAGLPADLGLGLGREIASAALSTAGLLALFNIDLLLARAVLPADVSGVYAVGSLFAKGAFWGPQFVATVLFPRMATDARRAQAVNGAVTITTVIGLAVVLVTAVAGRPLVAVVAGERYVELGPQVWLFATLGATLAVVQVLVYARLAVADGRLGMAAWVVIGCVGVTVVTVAHGSVLTIAGTALGGAATLVTAGLLIEWHSRRSAHSGHDHRSRLPTR